MSHLLSFEAEYECEGDFIESEPREYDRYFGVWTQGHGPDVLNFKIYKWKGKERFDVTHTFDIKEIEYLKNQYVLNREESQDDSLYENDNAS